MQFQNLELYTRRLWRCRYFGCALKALLHSPSMLRSFSLLVPTCLFKYPGYSIFITFKWSVLVNIDVKTDRGEEAKTNAVFVVAFSFCYTCRLWSCVGVGYAHSAPSHSPSMLRLHSLAAYTQLQMSWVYILMATFFGFNFLIQKDCDNPMHYPCLNCIQILRLRQALIS